MLLSQMDTIVVPDLDIWPLTLHALQMSSLLQAARHWA